MPSTDGIHRDSFRPAFTSQPQRIARWSQVRFVCFVLCKQRFQSLLHISRILWG